MVDKEREENHKSDETLEAWLEKGYLAPVQTDNNVNIPHWADPKLIEDGKEFVQRNFFGVFVSHFISLLFLFCDSRISSILNFTNKCGSSTASFYRFLGTLKHVRLWYQGNLLEQGDTAYKSLLKIKLIHAKVASKPFMECIFRTKKPTKSKSINKFVTSVRKEASKIKGQHCTHISETCSPAITQIDMIITQMCFVGFMAYFPISFGVFSNRGLKGFVHLWAVIGHMLGIEDEYNMCLPGNLVATRRNYIFYNKLIGGVKNFNHDTYRLFSSLIEGMSSVVPCLKVKPVTYYTFRNVLNIKCVPKGLAMTPSDRFYYNVMTICFQYAMKYSICRVILNHCLKASLELADFIHLLFVFYPIKIIQTLFDAFIFILSYCTM